RQWRKSEDDQPSHLVRGKSPLAAPGRFAVSTLPFLHSRQGRDSTTRSGRACTPDHRVEEPCWRREWQPESPLEIQRTSPRADSTAEAQDPLTAPTPPKR